MSKSIVDVLFDYIKNEVVELYSKEIVKDEKYQELNNKYSNMLDEICDEFPEAQKKITEFDDAVNDLALEELKFFYGKGIEDGIRLCKIFDKII